MIHNDTVQHNDPTVLDFFKKETYIQFKILNYFKN